MPPRKLPKTLSADEEAALLARPNIDCPTGLRNRAMLEVMLGNGLRVSECCGIHLRDVDWRAHVLRIRPEVAKGGREAVIPLAPEVVDWLERWKPVRRRFAAGAPWMFVTTSARCRSCCEALTEEVGPERVTQDVRVDGPLNPGLAGVAGDHLPGVMPADLAAVQRHADIRTTMIYTHVAPERLAEKLNKRRRRA